MTKSISLEEKLEKRRAYYREYNKTYTQVPEQKARRRESHKQWTIKLRLTIIKHYGGKCACCGETRSEFLSIDHKNGGGTKMRMNGFHPRAGAQLYSWIKQNNFPDMFQILCHNCNQAMGFYGVCPHQKERGK